MSDISPFAVRLDKVRRILQRLEDGILVGVLSIMIGMAVVQILLRNFFTTSVVWGDALVRIGVLWVGLIGAMVASRQGNHIRIDLISRYLPSRLGDWIECAVDLFTAAICAGVAYYSLVFVHSEWLYGDTAFAQVPTWLCEAIIPVAFTVMALRYLAAAVVRDGKTRRSAP